MTTSQETVEILNDLIEINNDRIVGYEKAIKELKNDDDSDLRSLFLTMIDESRRIKLDLVNEVQTLKGDVEKGTTASGKIYRAWMDVKAVFSGRDRHTILANCEFGEDAAQKAYKSALESTALPAFLRETIREQQQALRSSHDQIKALRDEEQHA
jgi:uncharacterized protein (TIGR02284 family)